MKTNLGDITKRLKNNKIRLSHQRLKVLEYLDGNRIHPTAEQIYHALHDEIPTLSKTTIYNTLNTLTYAGLVRSINIEDNEARYDIRTDAHGHFKCKNCGNIYDFEVDIDKVEIKDLEGFRVYSRDFYFFGICPKCMIQKNNSDI
ncbi:MAG: Fur family transcriptional regulator [Caldicoprobacterales bacterium]|jgi:Fur family peroxide stress response transcriptional regulator